VAIVIVPTYILEEANQLLGAALDRVPQIKRHLSDEDKEYFRSQLLGYFNEHGSFPPFEITPITKEVADE